MDVFDQSLKPNKPKTRQVKSRFLSPASPEKGLQSPKKTQLSSPSQNARPSIDTRKHKSLQKAGFLRGLWPSSSPSTPPSKSKPETLADHLGNDRRKEELKERKHNDKSDGPMFLNRQRSCTEFSRFKKDEKKIAKENHKLGFGGSMRYTGRSKNYITSVDDQSDDYITPGRFSVDETALRKNEESDNNSEYSDVYSGSSSVDYASFMAPTMSSIKHGIPVQSKYMNDSLLRSRRWSANFRTEKPVSSSDNSPTTSKSSMKMMGPSNFKPPTSPSRGSKGVGSLLSMGIELLKGKKYSSSNQPSSSPLGQGSSETVHQLRLLHNRLIQWRYSNARGEDVNGNVLKKVENNLLSAFDGLVKLQHSVLQKKLQLQKEKLEMKLDYILQSQIKVLETWGNMERDHISAVSTTQDYLQSVVCRIPLLEGAMLQVEPQSALVFFRHDASDVFGFIDLMLTKSAPKVEKTGGILVELARVVTQEKLLLQECLELLRTISALEIKERSLRCSIMKKKLIQQQQYHQELIPT